jgi:small-conductance mechanosensitive channel
MNRWLSSLEIGRPSYHELVSGGAALAIVLAALVLGYFIGRKAGPVLARFWERHAGSRGEALAEAMCALTRYLVAALILAVALNADLWPPLPSFILGFGLAATTALVIRGVVMALQMPRWVALLLAGVAFVAILSDAMGGLQTITAATDRVGFDAGKRHFSLLTLVQIAIGLLILLAVVRLLDRVINHSIRRTRRLDATQQLLAQKLAGIGLMVAAFFIGIDIIGIDLTALAVFSGAFGLAIGFGLQKTFGNLIAGIILLMDRSVKPGDVIVVGESFGSVTKIGVRAVSIVTRDGKEHLIPNENLMTQEVENWSYSSPNVRIHIPVGIAYDCDLPLAQRLMIEAAKAPARVLKTPEPSVWLRGFGESTVDHEILVWISDPQAGVGGVQSEILNRVWELFKEYGVELPNPQRDIHIKDWPSPPAGAA